MEQLGYSESRNTQQNVDFREELKAALDMDKDITPDEAKILTEKYEAVRDTMIEWKKQILAISKDELTSLSEGLDVSYASVWATIKKLYDVSMEDNNYTPPRDNVDTSAIQSTEEDQDYIKEKIKLELIEDPIISKILDWIDANKREGVIQSLINEISLLELESDEITKSYIGKYDIYIGNIGNSVSVWISRKTRGREININSDNTRESLFPEWPLSWTIKFNKWSNQKESLDQDSPQEAVEILKNLDRAQREYIQVITGAYPDSIIWNGTKRKLEAFLVKNNLDLSTLIDEYNINEFHLDYDYDQPLAKVPTMEQAKENFVNSKYNIIRSELESYLGLPTDFSLAIIQKESTFFTALNSGTWSKWWMQLTASPFEDMKWEGAKWETQQSTLNIRNNDIARYQKWFSKITFSEFKNISLWENEVIWDTLPDDIWAKLESISTASPDKAIVVISQLQTIIKAWSNNEKYLHTLNMIFWSVYLSDKYNRTSGTEKERVYRAAVNYNGDTKISTKNWITKEERYHYADRVVKNWENTNE